MEFRILMITYVIPVVITFLVLTYHGELRMDSIAQRIVLSLFPVINLGFAFIMVSAYLTEVMISAWNKLDKIG